MNSVQRYEYWLSKFKTDSEEYRELISIRDNKKEIENRFYKELEFGTAGMRGVLGIGTNMLNEYNARKFAIGFSKYLLNKYRDTEKIVVIAHDNRHMSEELTDICAKELSKNGIKVYLFDKLKTTPMLSFMVKKLGCVGGIMITASHNPSNYNGIKVYNSSGAQISTPEARELESFILKVEDIFAEDFSKDIYTRIFYMPKEIDDIYLEEVKNCVIRKNFVRKNSSELKIVYTPLCGTGLEPVTKVLKNYGFSNLYVVPEEENPDPEFSGIKKPNPEEEKALSRGIELLKKKKADLLIATDPDCDRIGIAINNGGNIRLINGNELGVLLVNYIVKSMSEKNILPDKSYIIKSIVTSDLGMNIAKKYEVETFEILTGFRFLAEKMELLTKSTDKNFLMGYEESYGYLVKGICRDKDAVSASLLVSELTLYYKKHGKTLVDVLEEIYKEYGYFLENTTSLVLEGKDGNEKISRIMNTLRTERIDSINSDKVIEITDFLDGVAGFEKSNVLKYRLSSGSWFAVRPSGTEPKLKIYFSAKSDSEKGVKEALDNMKKTIFGIIDGID